MTDPVRTPLEHAANCIDCDLYRILLRVEDLYDTYKLRNSYARENLSKTLQSLRSGRVGLRVLMHANDREQT